MPNILEYLLCTHQWVKYFISIISHNGHKNSMIYDQILSTFYIMGNMGLETFNSLVIAK